MGGPDCLEVCRKLERGKAANVQDFDGSQGAETPACEYLRKFEQSPPYNCQKSEYLTLLSSFPDVKKSD
jgi:hypothetical protein